MAAPSAPQIEDANRPHVGVKGYLFLIWGIIMFSGIFATAEGGWRCLDFISLLGDYGSIVKGGASGFRGSGGVGAREGFIFALTSLPAVGLALGCISVIDGQGGLKAAQRLLTPLLRPLLGIPGWCGLALMGSLQNTDTGAVMTAQLREARMINTKELTIFTAFLYSSSAIIVMYYTVGVLLFQYYPPTMPIIVPFAVCLVGKVFAANVMRLYLKFVEKKEDANVTS